VGPPELSRGNSGVNGGEVVRTLVAESPTRVATIVPLTTAGGALDQRLSRTKRGTDAQPSTGTFTSPSGQFSIAVTDTGITIAGPLNSIKLESDGSIKVEAGSSLGARAGALVQVDAGTSLDVRAGSSAKLDAGTSLDLKAGGTATLEAAAKVELNAPLIHQN
jgi:uncharacterized protein (DUF2345 family)